MGPSRAVLRPVVQRSRPLEPSTVPGRPPFILSDYNVIALSRNTALVKQFPFLALKTALIRTGCKCKGGFRTDYRVLTSEAGRVKAVILGLPPEEFQRFKKALNQDRIRILFPNGTTRDRA
jgi:hypothetical protein